MKDCPICDFSCFYCDANGCCMLDDPTECNYLCYYNNIDEEEEEEI